MTPGPIWLIIRVARRRPRRSGRGRGDCRGRPPEQRRFLQLVWLRFLRRYSFPTKLTSMKRKRTILTNFTAMLGIWTKISFCSNTQSMLIVRNLRGPFHLLNFKLLQALFISCHRQAVLGESHARLKAFFEIGLRSHRNTADFDLSSQRISASHCIEGRARGNRKYKTKAC